MRNRYRRFALVSTAALALSCGGAPPGTTEAPTPPPPSPTTTRGSFDLHEWGLVDVAANGAVELAAGPGSTFSVPAPAPDRPPISVRKPVVYFHLDPGAAPVALSLTVDVPGGRILEHWPTAQLAPASATFAGLELGPCESTRRAEPARGRGLALTCDSVDGVCEVRDLPTYVASDASCLRQDGTTLAHALLFYRADLPALDLPYLVTRSADGSVTLRVNPTYPAESIPEGEILRIRRDWSRVSLARVPTPRGGESTALARPEQLVDPAAERAHLAAGLVTAGLSPGEADAFCEAWASELFGPVTTQRATPNVDDLLLYALPRIAIDRTAPLRVTPEPRRSERVWLVRVELPR